MAANTKSFRQLVQSYAAAVQATASGLVDFSVGSILRAIGQATAGTALWLQALILALLATTRLSTSLDADADTFVADLFGPFADGAPATFARLGALASSGDVTFSRLTPTGQAVVPVGATVATQDGSQRFTVDLDTANPAYSAGLGGYVMADGVATVTVAASAITVGAASNVVAGSINTITSPITGVDKVTNASPFTNGEDTETTADFANRFRRHIIALREATPATILAYVEGLAVGVQAVNVEGYDPDGTRHIGFFYVIVDDGTGTPTSDLLNAARTVIDAHRADGIEFAVIAPTITTANIAFGLVSSLVDETPDDAAAVAAVRAYVNSLAIGETLIRTRLYQVAYDASPTITDIINLTVNGTTADLTAALPNVIKAGTVAAT